MGKRIPVSDDAPTVAFEDAVQVVFDALGKVPEFRDPRGRQIELHGTLGLAVLSIAAGHTSYRAIGEYGRLREQTLIPLLGLERAPSYSTIRRILQGVEAESTRNALRESARFLLSDKRRLVAATDGKTMRASLIDQRRSAHVVSVVEHNTGVIMDAEYCRQGEGELTAARRLRPKAAAGKAEIVAGTADALYANAADARRALEGGEVYVVKVKKTRPNSWKRPGSASSPAHPSPTSAARSARATAV